MNDKRFEIQRFKVENLLYELILPKDGTPGSVSLVLVGGYSPKVGDVRTIRESYDPFAKWGDDDNDDFSLMGDEDVGSNVFLLGRECLNRINGWVNREKPGYFLLSPSTERKEPIYDRFSKILEKKLEKNGGYQSQKIGNSYYFYRSCD